WYRAMTDDLQILTTTRVPLFKNEERRLAAIDDFARESRKLATLLPASFPDAPLMANQPSATMPSSMSIDPGTNRALVAWVSAVVLIVLVYLCFATILSIVRP